MLITNLADNQNLQAIFLYYHKYTYNLTNNDNEKKYSKSKVEHRGSRATSKQY